MRRARAERIGGDRFLELAAAEGLADRLSAGNPALRSAGLWIGDAVPDEIAPFAGAWVVREFRRP